MDQRAAPGDYLLFCKSYRRDLLRVQALLESVERHNVDGIPFVLCVPREDVALFRDRLGVGRFELITDENVAAAHPRRSQTPLGTRAPGLEQQIVKAEFWRLAMSAAYLCIDSDSEFIGDFTLQDFLLDDGTPLTVMTEGKELRQMAANRGRARVSQAILAESGRFRALFPRAGPAYAFSPSPFNWAAAVWEALDREYLVPRQTTLWDALTGDLPESLWYGEALLAFQPIRLMPVEPFFRVYHYEWQYRLLAGQGERPDRLAGNYLGIVRQSNWDFQRDYGARRKSLLSRAWRSVRRRD